jgi:hypothetical protein
VASVLGPDQAESVLDQWVDGPGSQEAYARLRQGEPCSLTLHPGIQRLTWQARPVRFLHLVEADGGPPCGRGHEARLLMTGRPADAR